LALVGAVPREVPAPVWWPQGGSIGVPSGRAILALFVGALFVWLAGRLLSRRVTYQTFWIVCAAGLAGMLVSETQLTLQILFPYFGIMMVLNFLSTFVAIPLGMVWFADKSVNRWLPNASESRGRFEMLVSPYASFRLWLRPAFYMVSIVLFVIGRVTEFYTK
jgi:hypothetical protein